MKCDESLDALLFYARDNISSVFKGRKKTPFNDPEIVFIKRAIDILKYHVEYDLKNAMLKNSLMDQLLKCQGVVETQTPRPTEIYSLGLNRYLIGEHSNEWSNGSYSDYYWVWKYIHGLMSGNSHISVKSITAVDGKTGQRD